MAPILFSEKTLSLGLSQNVQQICSPFYEQLGLTYFLMVRHFPDGSRIILTNSPEWNFHYYNSKYYNWDKFEKDFNYLKRSYTLWDSWAKDNISWDKVGREAEEDFNYVRGVSIIRPHGTHIDDFEICGDKNNTTLNHLYLHHPNLMEQFIEYFYEKANILIKKCEKNRFFLIDTTENRTVTEKDTYDCNLYSDQNLPENTGPSLIRELFLLTPKYQEVLHWLISGKTGAETSIILEISPRTMEKHLQAIKKIFKCQTLFELGIKIKTYGLDKLLQPTK